MERETYSACAATLARAPSASAGGNAKVAWAVRGRGSLAVLATPGGGRGKRGVGSLRVRCGAGSARETYSMRQPWHAYACAKYAAGAATGRTRQLSHVRGERGVCRVPAARVGGALGAGASSARGRCLGAPALCGSAATAKTGVMGCVVVAVCRLPCRRVCALGPCGKGGSLGRGVTKQGASKQESAAGRSSGCLPLPPPPPARGRRRCRGRRGRGRGRRGCARCGSAPAARPRRTAPPARSRPGPGCRPYGRVARRRGGRAPR